VASGGNKFWDKFRFAGREIRESQKTQSKTLAKKAGEKRQRKLEFGYNNLNDARSRRVQRLSSVAESYLGEYVLRHRSKQFTRYGSNSRRGARIDGHENTAKLLEDLMKTHPEKK
jgi:hypothetical protein